MTSNLRKNTSKREKRSVLNPSSVAQRLVDLNFPNSNICVEIPGRTDRTNPSERSPYLTLFRPGDTTENSPGNEKENNIPKHDEKRSAYNRSFCVSQKYGNKLFPPQKMIPVLCDKVPLIVYGSDNTTDYDVKINQKLATQLPDSSMTKFEHLEVFSMPNVIGDMNASMLIEDGNKAIDRYATNLCVRKARLNCSPSFDRKLRASNEDEVKDIRDHGVRKVRSNCCPSFDRKLPASEEATLDEEKDIIDHGVWKEIVNCCPSFDRKLPASEKANLGEVKDIGDHGVWKARSNCSPVFHKNCHASEEAILDEVKDIRDHGVWKEIVNCCPSFDRKLPASEEATLDEEKDIRDHVWKGRSNCSLSFDRKLPATKEDTVKDIRDHDVRKARSNFGPIFDENLHVFKETTLDEVKDIRDHGVWKAKLSASNEDEVRDIRNYGVWKTRSHCCPSFDRKLPASKEDEVKGIRDHGVWKVKLPASKEDEVRDIRNYGVWKTRSNCSPSFDRKLPALEEAEVKDIRDIHGYKMPLYVLKQDQEKRNLKREWTVKFYTNLCDFRPIRKNIEEDDIAVDSAVSYAIDATGGTNNDLVSLMT